MSMASKVLRTEEAKTNEGRTIAGIVNSIETLEGGGFLVRRPFPKASFPSLIRSCYSSIDRRGVNYR